MFAAMILSATLAATPPAEQRSTKAHASAPGQDAILIRNSGSTNLAGYRIVVRRGGDAELSTDGTVAHRTLDPALAAKLFEEVERAAPLDALPTPFCMKSTSFGSRTTVTWDGRASGDLSCGGGERIAALAVAVRAVAGACDLPSLLRRRLDGPDTR